jgi:hypothetical protein
VKDSKGKEISKDLILKMAHHASSNNLACFVPNISQNCPKREDYSKSNGNTEPTPLFNMKSGSIVII